MHCWNLGTRFWSLCIPYQDVSLLHVLGARQHQERCVYISSVSITWSCRNRGNADQHWTARNQTHFWRGARWLLFWQSILDQGCVTFCWYLSCFQQLSFAALHNVPSKRSGSAFVQSADFHANIRGQYNDAVIILASSMTAIPFPTRRTSFLRTWHWGILFDCLAGLLVKKNTTIFSSEISWNI